MSELETLEETIRSHRDPVVSVADVVDALEEDVSDTHVRNQMRLLERADALESKKMGARAVAWWHVDRVTAPLVAPEEHPGQTELSDQERERTESEATEDGVDGEETMDPDSRALEDVDTPSLSSRDEFESAAFAVFNLLRREGSVSRSGFIDALHGSHSAGYDNDRTWWRRVAKPVLDAHPEIKTPAGGNPWRFKE